MLKTKKNLLLIAFIFLIGFGLRFMWLGQAEIVGDEPMYTVRSQGWFDSLASQAQTTPYDWFTVLPWWTKLSFHDHPPLVFAFYHVGWRLLGDPLLASRLVSGIASMLAGLFIYLFCARIGEKKTGILAATLWTVNCAAVGFARLALMESITVCIIMATIYLAAVAGQVRRRVWQLAILIGLGIITKYVTIVFLPLYAGIFYAQQKKLPSVRSGIISALIIVSIVSPVIIYNLKLFQYTGHFDVQIASALGQATPEWSSLLGKEVRGSILNRIINLNALAASVSPLFLSFSLSFIILGIAGYWRTKKVLMTFWWSVVGLACVGLLILLAGSAVRFVFYSVPFLCIICGFGFSTLMDWIGAKIIMICFGMVIIFEILYTVNSIILPIVRRPLGYKVLMYAPALIIEDQGIISLDAFLDQKLKAKVSNLPVQTASQSFNTDIARYAIKHQRVGVPQPIILVYDSRVEIRTLLYVFARRTFYEGWPIVSTQDLPKLISSLEKIPNGQILFVHSTEKTVRNQLDQDGGAADTLAKKLLDGSAKHEEIKNIFGEVVFQVFTISTSDLSKIRVY